MTDTMDAPARTGTYEMMFLAGQSQSADFGALIEHIEEIVSRANGEVLAMQKWDERRLAYTIDKQKRGIYVLVYVSCPTDGPAHVERDVVISDRLMRVMIVRADHLSDEEIASNDDREGLRVEANMRRDQTAAGEERRSTVTLGAPPTRDQAGDAGDEDEQADAAPVSEAESNADESSDDENRD